MQWSHIMGLRVIYIYCLFFQVSCIAQKTVLKSSYLKHKKEVLEYTQTTRLNDTMIKETKLLWNENGKMCWFDSISNRKSNYEKFHFTFVLLRDTFFLTYTNSDGKDNSLPFFPGKIMDTLQAVNFHELQNNNIQYRGVVTYNDTKRLHLLGNNIDCYVFKINEGIIRSSTKKEKIKD